MRLGWLVDGARSTASRGAVEEIASAEADGFDAIWLGAPAGASAAGEDALLLCAAAVADATQSARLGVAAAPSASFHPLRLAEDLAMVDIVAGGRLDWIVPAPASPWLELVLTAWRGEPFAYEGEGVSLPELVCLPTPVQRPHPRLWLAPGAARPRSADPAALGWLGTGAALADAAHGAARALVVRIDAEGRRPDPDARALVLSPDPSRWADELAALAQGSSADWLIADFASPDEGPARARRERIRFLEAARRG